MGEKFYSTLHRYVCILALVAGMLSPFFTMEVKAVCSTPTDLSVTNLSATTATLTWDVTASAQHVYDIIVSSTEIATGNLAAVNATTPGVVVYQSALNLTSFSYPLTGLSAGTHYYAYLRQDCSWDYQGYSDWVRYEFYTPCLATSVLPVSADFDGGVSIPSCWSTSGVAPIVQSAPYSGTGNAVKMNATGDKGGFLYSPVFSGAAQAYYLTAKVCGTAGTHFSIGVAAMGYLDDVLGIYTGTITETNVWQTIDYAVPAELHAALAYSEYVLVFQNAASDLAAPYFLDDIYISTIPTCLSPISLVANEVTENSITLAWTERGNATSWKVEVANGENSTIVNATTNPFTLTGLNASTQYRLRAKAVCSASDESSWSEWINVKTVCGIINLPYSENFDSYSGAGSTITVPTNWVIPDCWAISVDNTVSNQAAFINSYSGYASTGNCLFLKSSTTYDPVYVFLPGFNANDEVTQMVFKYRNESTNAYNGPIVAGYVTTPGDASTFVALATLPIVATLTEAEVTFPAVTTIYPAFKYQDNSTTVYYASIEDVVVRLAPTCVKPSNLHIADFGRDFVKLAWTANGNETNWVLTYQLGNGQLQTVQVSNAPEYTITGLTAQTNYTLSGLSVQAVCSSTELSDVFSTGNLTFTTLCDAVSLIEEDFENQTTGSGNFVNCWTKTYSSSATSPYVYNSSSYAHSGTNSLYAYAYSSSPLSAMVALPEVTGDVKDYRIKFWAYKSSASYDADMVVGVMSNPADSATFVAIDTIQTTSAYTQYAVSFAPYTGAGKFAAFKYDSIFTTIYLDDVVLEPVPSCDRPEGLVAMSVDATTVDVEINDPYNASGTWEIVVDTVGFDPALATPFAVNKKNASVTLPFSMVAGHEYQAYVRFVCAADDKSAWRGPASFTFVDWSALSSQVAIKTGNPYPWNLEQKLGTWVATSGNPKVAKSVSDLIVTVDVPANTKTTFSFDWAVNCYKTYSFLCIYVDEETPSASNMNTEFGKKGGASTTNLTANGSYSVVFTTPGKHTIRFRHDHTYSYAGTYGNDNSTLSNFAVTNVNCVEPSVFNMGDITSTSAVVNWNNTGADRWVAALFTEPQTAINVANALHLDTVQVNNFTYTDLTPNTQYYMYFRSICDNTPSDWSQVLTFRTECAAVAVPYFEDFEDQGALLCWKTIGEAVTVGVTGEHFEGMRAASVHTDSVNVMLISPRFDVTSLANYEVNLAAYGLQTDTLSIGVIINPNNLSTYVDLGEIGIPQAKQWNEYRQSLAALATADYADYAGAAYIAISVPAYRTIYFDALSVEAPSACPKPTAMSALPAGEDVVINWESDAAAHTMEILLASDSSVVFSGAATKPYTTSGLAGNTSYMVRVRAICDGENSAWTSWYNFKTPCSLASLPYVENFDSYTAPSALTLPAAPVLPDCWSLSIENTLANQCAFLTSSTTYAVAGNCLFLRATTSTDPIYAFLPPIDAQNKATRMTFWYKNESTTTSNGPIVVGYVTTPGDTATFVPVLTTAITSTKTKVETFFPAMQVLYPVIRYINNSTTVYYASVDEIEIDEAPSCVKPSQTTYSVGADNIKLNWQPGGSETAWELSYRLLGASNQILAADTVVVTEPTLTITGLEPASNYTLSGLKLRAICSATDSSEVITYVDLAIATQCETINLPFNEDFNGLSAGIPNCWDNSVGTAADTYKWAYNANGVTGACVRFNSFTAPNGAVNVLMTPSLQVSNTATQVFVNFQYKNATGGDFTVILSRDNGEHFTDTLATGLHATAWTQFRDTLTNVAGQTLILAFVGTSNYGSGDAYLYLDDVEIAEPADCERVTALTLVSTTSETAAIQIEDAADATAWEYALGNQDATPVALTENVFTITGLSEQTTYDVFVRRVCSPTSKSGWRKITLTTACGAVDYVEEGFENCTTGSSGQRVPDCWTLVFNNNSTYPYVSSGAASAASGEKYFYNYGYASTTSDYSSMTALPQVVGNLNQYRLIFKAKKSSATADADIVIAGLESVGADYNTALTRIATINDLTTTYQQFSISLAAYTGQGKYVAFWFNSPETTIYLDDVILERIPTCEKPNAAIVGISANSFTIATNDNTASAWEYCVDDIEATPVLVTTDTFVVAGLASSSEHTIYVRSVCSETDKSRFVALTAMTACEAANLPFSENFDALTTGIPACWNNDEGTTTNANYKWTYYATGKTGHCLRFNSYVNSSGLTNVLKSAPVNVGNRTAVQVSFQYKNATGGDYNAYISRDGGMTYSDTLGTHLVAADWTECSATLTTSPNEELTLVLFGKSNYGSGDAYLYVDDVLFDVPASCERPDAISVGAITATSVDVNITDALTEHDAWEVVVVAKNAAVTTGTPVLVNTKNAVITASLISGNVYDLYVRTVCGSGVTSAWRGPVSFKFVDYSSVSTLPLTGDGDYPWAVNLGRLESTNQGIASSTSDLVASFNIPAGQAAHVSFNYYAQGEGTTTMYDYLCMYIDVPNPSTSNFDMGFGQKGTPTGETGIYTFDLPAGLHQVRWRFRKDGSGNSGDDMGQIWNLTVSYSSFFTPIAVHVEDLTATTATVRWASGADAVRDEVKVVSNDTIISASTTENSLALTNLLPRTDYAVRVRSFNAEGDSTNWSSQYVFTTACGFVTEISEDFEEAETGTGKLPDCWVKTYSSSTSYPYVYNSASSSHAGAHCFYALGSSSSPLDALVAMPGVDGNLSDYRMSLWVKKSSTTSNAAMVLGVMSNPANENSFVPVDTIVPTLATYEQFVVPFTSYVGAGAYPAMRFLNCSTSLYVDDILFEPIPSCEKPAGISLINATSTQVDLAIQDNEAAHTSWEVVFGPRGFNLGAEGVQSVVTSSKLVSIIPTTALISDSTYQAYVRAICAEDDMSAWAKPVTFQYIDLSGVSNTSINLNGSEYPWTLINDAGVQKLQSTNQGVQSTTSDMVANFVVGEGEKGLLTFNYYAEGEGTANPPSYDYLCIFVDEPNPTHGSTGNMYADFSRKGTTSGMGGTYTLALPVGTHTVRWSYRKDGSNNGGIDAGQVWNIRFVSTDKWAPDNIRLVSAGTDTAVIAWDQCANVVKNEVVVGRNTYQTTDASNSIVLRGLAANTLYTAQIRSILANDTTAWSADFTFRTDCGLTNLPYVENFESYTEGVATSTSVPAAPAVVPCWNYIGVPQTTNTAAFMTSYSTYGNGSQYLLLKNTNAKPLYLVLPELNTEGQGANVHFEYRNQGSTSSNGIISLGYFNELDSSFIAVMSTTPVNTMTSVDQEVNIPANHRLAFRYLGGSTSSYNASIDNIRISRMVHADTIVDHACSNYDYVGYGFQIDKRDLTVGEHIFSFTDYAETNLAADTVRTLQLTVDAPSIIEFHDTICANAHYTGYGFDIESANPLRTEPYVRQLTNAAGCDSTVTLYLYVPDVVREYSATICEGESFLFGDTTIYTSGVYTRVATSPYECDSVITVRLTVQGTHAEIYDSICPGQSYFFNNELIYEPGVYTETTLRDGCDSVTTLYLSFAAPVLVKEEYDVCSNKVFNYPVAIPGLHDNLFSLTEAGVYRDTVQTADGCTEIIEVTLVVNPIEYDTVRGQVADGEPFVYGAQTYTKAGTYEQVLATEDGCDKFVTIILVAATGLENVQVYDLEIAPNPVNIGEEAVILTDLDLTDDYLVHVYDAVGKLVARSSAANGRIPALSAAGIYTVRITAGDKQYQSKLVVK